MGKKELLQRQKEVFDWMFKAQEEELKQRGYSCNDDGTRSLIIDLSVKNNKLMNKEQIDILEFLLKSEKKFKRLLTAIVIYVGFRLVTNGATEKVFRWRIVKWFVWKILSKMLSLLQKST